MFVTHISPAVQLIIFSMLLSAEEKVELSAVCGVEQNSKKCSEMCSAVECCLEKSGPGSCSDSLSNLCEQWSPCWEGLVISRRYQPSHHTSTEYNTTVLP